MTASKQPHTKRCIADPDERIINIDKFCKKLTGYVNDGFAFSDWEKKETIEEVTDLVISCCASHSSQTVPDALSKENITISAVCGYEAGLEAGAKAERERVLDLIRTTDGGACPYELCRSGNGHDGLNCRDCLVKWIEESLRGGEQR